MKMKLMVLVVGFVIMGANLYAAPGDLVVGGNASVTGTTTLNGAITTNDATVNGVLVVPGGSPTQVKVDITGGLKVNGVTFTSVQYVNMGEDVYGTAVSGNAGDDCNGDISNLYDCPPDVEKTCTDTTNALGYRYRQVQCFKQGYLMIR